MTQFARLGNLQSLLTANPIARYDMAPGWRTIGDNMRAIHRPYAPATPALGAERRRRAVQLAVLLATAVAVTPVGEALAEPAPTAPAFTPADPLWTGFQDPPRDAKPYIWWHWLNGNVTEEGL